MKKDLKFQYSYRDESGKFIFSDKPPAHIEYDEGECFIGQPPFSPQRFSPLRDEIVGFKIGKNSVSYLVKKK